jgi:hypothetical protein
MTEIEWQRSPDPWPMLTFVSERASERKLWLFVCACCRFVWHLLPPGCRQAVDLVEEFADGEATEQAVLDYFQRYPHTMQPVARKRESHYAVDAVRSLGGRGRGDVRSAANQVAIKCMQALAREDFLWNDDEAKRLLARLLRDLFGNPFRPAVIAPACLTWNDGCTVRIAQAIYDKDDFGSLPILADALEDAGCDDADLLNHCRDEGPHVRGCWVVDLLLGKE